MSLIYDALKKKKKIEANCDKKEDFISINLQLEKEQQSVLKSERDFFSRALKKYLLKSNKVSFSKRLFVFFAIAGILALLIFCIGFFSNALSINQPVSVKAPVLSWTCSGIMYSQDEPICIVNNIILKKGEMVNGAEVLNIKPKSVILRKAEKEITLEWK